MEIEKLRSAKDRKGYSYQRIVDESEKLGNAVSLSTVKRVFAPGAEPCGFNPATLHAIAQVLGVDESAENGADLQAALAARDARIRELEAQIAQSAEYTEGRLNYLKDEGQNKLDFIFQQEQNRQETQAAHEKQIKHKDHIIFALVVFIIMLMTGYICLLIYDVMHPEIGFIRGGLQALFNMIFGVRVFSGGML